MLAAAVLRRVECLADVPALGAFRCRVAEQEELLVSRLAGKLLPEDALVDLPVLARQLLELQLDVVRSIVESLVCDNDMLM
jgi:hypothetical protein